MTIEDIIDFDQNNLNSLKPIGLKTLKKTSWWNIITIMICISIAILAIFFIINCKNYKYLWLISLILSLILFSIKLYCVINFYISEIEEINKSYMIKYKLKMNKNSYIFLDQKDLSNIRYRLFIDFINDMEIKISKEEIDKIIESLKYEISAPKHHYTSLTIITTLFTLLVSTALASFIKLGNNFNDILMILVQCCMVLLVLLLVILEIERVIFKDFLTSKKNRYQRLIRVLENYSINIKQG